MTWRKDDGLIFIKVTDLLVRLDAVLGIEEEIFGNGEVWCSFYMEGARTMRAKISLADVLDLIRKAMAP